MLGRVLDEAAAQQQRQTHGTVSSSSGEETEHFLPKKKPHYNFVVVEGEDQSEASDSWNNGRSKSKSTAQSSYGATSTVTGDGVVVYEDEEDEETLDDGGEYDSDDDDDAHSLSSKFGLCGYVWKCLRIVADVDDIWDSPDPNSPVAQVGHQEVSARRKKFIVGFWFIVLATSYAGERSTFKFLVDQSGPFRLFTVEMVTATHAIVLGLGLFIAYLLHRIQQKQKSGGAGSRSGRILGEPPPPPQSTTFDLPLGLPIVDVGLMALLDVVGLMLVFLTGIYVSPTLTVILVQFTLPLTAFLMQCVHPQGRFACCRPTEDDEEQVGAGGVSGGSTTSPSNNLSPAEASGHVEASSDRNNRGAVRIRTSVSNTTQGGTPIQNCAGLAAEHLCGSALICLSCVFALVPSFYTIIDPDFFLYADPIPLRVAYNSLFFLSACVPAAASQLYKEHVFLKYKQPVNVHKLNLLLSILEFIFASVLAPLVFVLLGLGSEKKAWYTLYPSEDFSDNFLDGLLCFFRLLDEKDQTSKYPEEARCDFVLGLTILHTVCVIMVGVAVDKIVSTGASKLMYRGISAGIILAVVCMAIYDFHIPEFSFGPFVDALNLFCLLLLILGSEIYHRVTLPDSTFETVYPSLDNIYDDD